MSTKKKAAGPGKHKAGTTAPIHPQPKHSASKKEGGEKKDSKVEQKNQPQAAVTAAPVASVAPVTTAAAAEPSVNGHVDRGVDIEKMDVAGVTTALAQSRVRIDELTASLEDEKAYAVTLYKRFQRLQDGFMDSIGMSETKEPQDGRKVFNPEKNLKISAIRAYGWAKRQNKTADEARKRVLERTLKSAKQRYSMSRLPESVDKYIEDTYRNYENLTFEKEEETVNA